MFAQNQASRALSVPSSQTAPASFVSENRLATPGAIVCEVCEVFEFADARGDWQASTCTRALANLADRGRISLPAPTNSYAAGAGPRLLPKRVPLPNNLPELSWPLPDGLTDAELEVVLFLAQAATARCPQPDWKPVENKLARKNTSLERV